MMKKEVEIHYVFPFIFRVDAVDIYKRPKRGETLPINKMRKALWTFEHEIRECIAHINEKHTL